MSKDDLTTSEVAAQCQVTQAAVTGWLRSGKLPGYRMASRWRVKKMDLAEFIRRGIPQVPEGQRKTT